MIKAFSWPGSEVEYIKTSARQLFVRVASIEANNARSSSERISRGATL